MPDVAVADDDYAAADGGGGDDAAAAAVPSASVPEAVAPGRSWSQNSISPMSSR